MSTEGDGYIEDDWPCMPDGSKFNGIDLMLLDQSGNSPFKQDWDVEQLIAEVEQKLDTKIIDIPMLYNGSNNYVRSSYRTRIRYPVLDNTDMYVRASI